MKECNQFNLSSRKQKINVDHRRMDDKNTVNTTIDTYFYNTPINTTRTDSESGTISRANMSVNGNKRRRRLLIEPSKGDLNLAFDLCIIL